MSSRNTTSALGPDLRSCLVPHNEDNAPAARHRKRPLSVPAFAFDSCTKCLVLKSRRTYKFTSQLFVQPTSCSRVFVRIAFEAENSVVTPRSSTLSCLGKRFWRSDKFIAWDWNREFKYFTRDICDMFTFFPFYRNVQDVESFLKQRVNNVTNRISQQLTNNVW